MFDFNQIFSAKMASSDDQNNTVVYGISSPTIQLSEKPSLKKKLSESDQHQTEQEGGELISNIVFYRTLLLKNQIKDKKQKIRWIKSMNHVGLLQKIEQQLKINNNPDESIDMYKKKLKNLKIFCRNEYHLQLLETIDFLLLEEHLGLQFTYLKGGELMKPLQNCSFISALPRIILMLKFYLMTQFDGLLEVKAVSPAVEKFIDNTILPENRMKKHTYWKGQCTS